MGSHIQFNLSDITMGLPLPSDMKILKVGEIPVDAVKVSTISSIGNKGDGKGIAPDPKYQENAFFLAPQDEGGWAKKADMIESRVWFKSVMINDEIYCMGGMNANFQLISSVEAYDFLNNKWTIKEKMVVPRMDFAVEPYDGKIYAFGGSVQGGGDSLESIEEYDPEINKWSLKNNMPIKNGYMSSTINDGLIYIIGGYSSVVRSQVYAYNPKTDKWERKADLPIPICSGEACSYNGKIYFMGGYTNVFSISKKVFEYDPIIDKWIELTELPEARVLFTVSVVNNKIYVIGGHSPKGTLSEIDIYDPLTKTWGNKINMPEGRSGLCSEVINSKSIH
jgi:N-acetylneuraminic acid mutarotase